MSSPIHHPNYFAVRESRARTGMHFTSFPLTPDRDGWICRHVPPNARVLEIGAGERPFLPELQRRGFVGTFRTMDIDRDQRHDFYSISDISGVYDVVIMREVAEHLERHVFYEYLAKISCVLASRGILALTTPNPWCPGWMWVDYTHISPWPPADMIGILSDFGFDTSIHRVIWPSRWLWLKRLYWAVHSRCYDLDFAGSYVAIGCSRR
jgi:hypothetical protein